MKKAISFRLRAIDDDLIQAIQNIESDALSDLCRDGLRYMLGIDKTKQMVVEEKPITRAVSAPSPAPKQTQFPSTIFRPNIRL